MTDNPDFIKNVPWEEVAEHLGEHVDSLHSLLATIQSGVDRENRSLELFNLGFRCAKEVERAQRWLEEGNDLLAWCVRNLFECHLILRKVMESDDALKQWAGQLIKDEQDIISSFQVLKDSYSMETNKQHDQIQRNLDNLADQLGLEASRFWSVRDLARDLGREREYRLIFRFLSKYVHPSSWVINAASERTNSTGYRNQLVGLVLVFARRVYTDLETDFGLSEAVTVTKCRAIPWKATSYDGTRISDWREIQSSLLRELDSHVEQWKTNSGRAPTLEDIEALDSYAMSGYVTQRFDWSSWPRWQLQSAKLYGAAHAFRTKLGASNNASLPHEGDEAVLECLLSDLGEDAFKREFATGQCLSWSQAVRLALDVP